MKPTRVLLLFLIHILPIIEGSEVPLGVIYNASLKMINANATLIHGTCRECLCMFFENATFFALNCFTGNLTCELHSVLDQNKPFTLTPSANTVFYFLSLPTFTTLTSTDSTCANEVTFTSTGKFMNEV